MILLKSLLILLLITTTVNAGERLSILTLNVAGLPDAFTPQDYPHVRMNFISQRASQWDLVAYQEDFYYSHRLDEHDTFDTTYRGTKWKRWAYFVPWLKKSGLTIKTNLVTERPKFFAYEKCYGYSVDGNDCWVPKGVLCVRTSTPGGVLIDFCTTHLDAGDTEGSRDARRHQIGEYLEFVGLPSAPSELNVPWLRIETGDFNLRMGEEDLLPLLKDRNIVVSNLGGGKDVDYIMVTTNDRVKVKIIGEGKVPIFNGLSDHPAIGLVLDLEY